MGRLTSSAPASAEFRVGMDQPSGSLPDSLEPNLPHLPRRRGVPLNHNYRKVLPKCGRTTAAASSVAAGAGDPIYMLGFLGDAVAQRNVGRRLKQGSQI